MIRMNMNIAALLYLGGVYCGSIIFLLLVNLINNLKTKRKKK